MLRIQNAPIARPALVEVCLRLAHAVLAVQGRLKALLGDTVCRGSRQLAVSLPGLVPLLVGVVAAKTLSSVLNIPFIAVNHLEGHALSAHLEKEIEYPYLLLLVSGGHTEFTIINKFNNYKRIGTTLDDALGEAFDKTARLLNLGYPGGPEIEKNAKKGNENKFKLPILFFLTDFS